MTQTTEEKALALWNEVRAEREYPYQHTSINRKNDMVEALCRAIEQHEAFRQEVSDALRDYYGGGYVPADSRFAQFIIPAPKPDPLVDVLLEMELSSDLQEGQHDAIEIRKALDALGFEIREKKDV